YVPSWGGSMFEALMPTLVLDEPRWAAGSLGPNDVSHAAIQRRWAGEELGLPVWGMSPCATPSHDGYGEYGVRLPRDLRYPPRLRLASGSPPRRTTRSPTCARWPSAGPPTATSASTMRSIHDRARSRARICRSIRP